MISKDAVKRNFSRSADMYHREAVIQKASAQILVDYLKPHQHSLIEGSCLEIGCGTGFVTSPAVKLFPEREWIVTDFSQEMVDFCKSQMAIAQSHRIHFKCLDAESLHEEKKYALVISGMTIQWFRNIFEGISRMLHSVKDGGLLCFSFLETDTFPEWKKACDDLDIPYTGHPLPSAPLICQTLKRLCKHLDVYRDSVTVAYENSEQFFKHLKRIGANASSQPKMLPHEMAKLKTYWDEQSPFGINVTYKIAYVIAEK